MSELKEKLTKQVVKISDSITDEKEKNTVLEVVKDMIQTFTEYTVTLTTKQSELEERVDGLYDVLSEIEEEMLSIFEGEEMEGECPYCGETISFTLPEDDSQEIKCPKCHNTIELELMFDGQDGCCGCDCDDCQHECDGEDDEEKNI